MGYGCGFYYFVGDLMALIDRACWERGCACYDDRIDKDVVEVVRRDWVGLTDEELSVAIADAWGRRVTRYYQYEAFYKDVEAKLKEKNT